MKYLLFFFLVFCHAVSAQKVALVMSGGAAKGIAHVGVLKALEEHDIPVDYVVGTSMGGIIGGIYASGLSPYQIEDIVTSARFLRWIKGLPEEGQNHYFHNNGENPGFLRLDLSLDSTLNVQFNSSLASDVSINFALAENLAQAAAISGNNFDSLFIPLRVVAADIFTQSEVVLKEGLLSNALRATQTVPYFYNPIRVDGRYLFDGGVYNNFPVDVAEEEFSPDVIIGVNVSTRVFKEYPYEKDDHLISNSLLYLLLDKSDPGKLDDDGIFIQPNLSGYTSFNFDDARSLIDSGYVQTLRQMDEIKRKIQARRTCDEVTEARNRFTNRSVPFVYDGILFNGFNQKQSRYISRIFGVRPDKPRPLYHREIVNGYFELVSESYFSNVFPNILYDTTVNRFQLLLSRRPQRNFQVDFGGVIATRNISNIFLGLNYYHFNKSLSHFSLGFQTGSFYKNLSARVRVDNLLLNKFYVEPNLYISSWDYLESEDLLQKVSSTVLKRVSRTAGVDLGWPIGSQLKLTAGIDGFNNDDTYSNDSIFNGTVSLDELNLKGFKAGLSLGTRSLNRKQYASSGKAFSVAADFFNTTESYRPGNTSVKTDYFTAHHQWFRFKFSGEQYFSKGRYHPGYFFEGVFSNQPPFRNYFGTIINAPAFSPLQDSPTLVLEKFRSFNYLAGGIRNVFSLRSKLDLRVEGYVFKPIDYLVQNENQDVVETGDLTKLFFAASTGLVHHSPIGPISLSVNYYDDSQYQLGVLLHVGFLLFHQHPME